MKNNTLVSAITVLALHASFSFGTPVLKVSQGTLSAGGMLTFPVEWVPSRQVAILINAEPKFGIFVVDRLQLTFGAELKTPIFEERLAFGGLEDRWQWGLSMGLQYVFDFDLPVSPFIGFDMGYHMSGFSVSSIRASLGMPIGVLLPINENIAFTFGLQCRIYFIGQGKVIERVRCEPGYFGVQAFF